MPFLATSYKFFAPKPLLYIRMESNRFEIKDMKTGERIKQTAMVPFSNDRLLITDNLIAETFCKQLIHVSIPDGLAASRRIIFDA